MFLSKRCQRAKHGPGQTLHTTLSGSGGNGKKFDKRASVPHDIGWVKEPFPGKAAADPIRSEELVVSKSVLEAIREGKWDFEPEFAIKQLRRFRSTVALPGSKEKVSALAARAESGLPLWHPEDRKVFDEANVD